MRRCLLYLFISSLTSSGLRSQSLEKVNFTHDSGLYDVMVIKVSDTLLHRIDILELKGKRSERQIFDSLGRKGLFFSCTAGIVDASCRLLGLYIRGGKELQGLNSQTGTGNFYLPPNGFFGGGKGGVYLDVASAYGSQDSLRIAVQSGPMLLVNGAINNQFDPRSANKQLRLGVGSYQEGGEDFLVFAVAKNPVNFHSFASLFLEKLHCTQALNLESGPVVSFHLPSAKGSFSDSKFPCQLIYVPL